MRIKPFIAFFTALCLIALAGTTAFAQTEEQQKHPKYPDFMQYYQAYKEADGKGDYAAAAAAAKKALELGLEIFGPEDPVNATLYNNYGSALESTGAYDQAIEYYKKALAIDLKKFGPEHPDTAIDYNNLGGAYESKGEYDQAIEYCQKALAIGLKTLGPEHPNVATYYDNLGMAYYHKGEYDQAIKYYKKAISINMKMLGAEHPELAKNYSNLGGAYRYKGEYDQAIECHKKALAIDLKRLGPEHPNVAVCYNNLGMAYERKGEYDQAKEYFQKALTIDLKRLGPEHPNIATTYYNLGGAYESKGEYDQAIEYYQKALAIDLKKLGPEHPNVATYYNNLGGAYRYKGEYDQALEYYQKTLAIFIKVLGADHPNVAVCYNNLGMAYGSKGEYDQAIEYYKKALAIALKRLGPENPGVTTTYNNLGGAYYYKGEYDQAIEYFKKALAIVIKSGAYQQSVGTAVNLGLLYLERNLPAEAKKTFSQALAVIDTARERFTAGKGEFTARNINCYYYALKASALMKDSPGAFDAAERMKARGFLERLSLSAALAVDGVGKEDASRMLLLNDEIESLTSKRNAEINKPAANQDDKKLLAISEELQKKLKEFEALDAKLLANERYRALRKPRTATLDEAKKLAGDRAILEYIIWEKDTDAETNKQAEKHRQSWCMVIRGSGVTLVPLDKDFDYTGTVMKYREALLKRGASRGVKLEGKKADEAGHLGALLYDKLIAPVVKDLGDAKEIIIVPDGALAFLPFDALRKDSKEGFLCEKYAITMAPSVSVLLMTKGRSFSAQREEFLAFGGGLYSATGAGMKRGARGGVKAREISDKARDYYASRSGENKGAYYDRLDLRWVDLPGTADEVAAIHSGVYGGKGAKIVTGKDVSEKTVKEYSKKGELARYKSLHMACHGYYDKDSPSFSAVVLSEVSGKLKGQSDEDGYLSIEEAALLNLKAEIVNLSACETGLGKIVSGDGVVGLTRAFNVAGANRVGVTLWQVDDEATKDFMVAVYRKVVKEKKPFGTAYVETKREFIKSKAYGDPYYWSPFVLYGE